MNSPEGRQFLSALQQSNQTPTASDGSDQRTVFLLFFIAEGRIFVGGGVDASAASA